MCVTLLAHRCQNSGLRPHQFSRFNIFALFALSTFPQEIFLTLWGSVAITDFNTPSGQKARPILNILTPTRDVYNPPET